MGQLIDRGKFPQPVDRRAIAAEGRLELVIGGRRFRARPGDQVFIPKGAVHSLKNVHHATTRWLYGYD